MAPANASDTPGAVQLLPAPGYRLAVMGGCGGIGRVLVAAARTAGLRVAVLDLPASIAVHAPPADCRVLSLDATRADDVDAAFATLASEWGGLDGVVNLCGFAGPRKPVQEIDAATWREVVTANLDAAFLVSRAAVPCLLSGEAPSLVHVASSLAVKAAPGYGPYAASKAGMLALVRILAAEHAPRLRVNAVAPSAVRTEFITGGTGRTGGSAGTPLLDLDAYGRALPLGRVADPEDVVGPILFLLGPASRYMTGQVLHVNGGLWQP